MLDTLFARAAALRLELIKLDGLKLSPLAGGNHVELAACHLQSAVDILDQVHALQAATTITVDDDVQRLFD